MLTNQLVQSNREAASVRVETLSLALFLDIVGPLYHVISTIWISLLVCSASKFTSLPFFLKCVAAVFFLFIAATDYLLGSGELLFLRVFFGKEARRSCRQGVAFQPVTTVFSQPLKRWMNQNKRGAARPPTRRPLISAR